MARRSEDRRFYENFEQYNEWVDHKASQVQLPELSIVEILEASPFIDLPNSMPPCLKKKIKKPLLETCYGI